MNNVIQPVISPDLVREVEARMNRNYMPPSLVQMQHPCMMVTANTSNYTNNNNNNNGSNSPPTTMNTVNFAPVTGCGGGGGVVGVNSNGNNAGNNIVVARRFGRCYNKLPTVQEVGK